MNVAAVEVSAMAIVSIAGLAIPIVFVVLLNTTKRKARK